MSPQAHNKKTSSDSTPHLRVVDRDERPPVALDDFDGVYRRFAPYVATIGLRILGNPTEVDDLVQDVFLVAHADLKRVRSPDRVRAWLATIAVRKAMRRLRRGKILRLLSLEETDSYEDLAVSDASPEDRAEIARVYRSLERMSVGDRVVWVLRHIEGQTLDEVVEHSGLSKSTVQRRLKRVEERLKRRDKNV